MSRFKQLKTVRRAQLHVLFIGILHGLGHCQHTEHVDRNPVSDRPVGCAFPVDDRMIRGLSGENKSFGGKKEKKLENRQTRDTASFLF